MKLLCLSHPKCYFFLRKHSPFALKFSNFASIEIVVTWKKIENWILNYCQVKPNRSHPIHLVKFWCQATLALYAPERTTGIALDFLMVYCMQLQICLDTCCITLEFGESRFNRLFLMKSFAATTEWESVSNTYDYVISKRSLATWLYNLSRKWVKRSHRRHSKNYTHC